jgi:hypothetical protein
VTKSRIEAFQESLVVREQASEAVCLGGEQLFGQPVLDHA